MRLSVFVGAVVLAVGWSAASAQGSERKLYDLRYRPAPGQRIAYEESLDSTLTLNVDANRARVSTTVQTTHAQLIVTSEEPLAFDAAGAVTAKRISFAPGCFAFVQVDDKPRRVHRLPYGGKTVTFKLMDDGTVEQDFGVKGNGEQMRKLRDSIFTQTSAFPAGGVSVGDRWRADDVMRAAMNLQKDDTVSTIFTFKGVREHDGRAVADVGMTAGVLKFERGISLEISLEGGLVVDVETGLPIKFDFAGTSNLAGASCRVGLTGAGTYEYHRAARLLPASEPTARSD